MEPVEECLLCHRPVSLHGGILCRESLKEEHGDDIEVVFVWLFKLDYNQCEYKSEHVIFKGREFSFTGRLEPETREMPQSS